ncbi:MAG: Rpn family recombination-promoting nuclease/putative transposase [bacterium]|nr:Rpn family recombination-promoting nuclease/putative transposase [bacterium]
MMLPLLTPKLDLVFKLLFVQDTEILLDLVNRTLASPEPLHIQHLEVKNPTILPEELTEKYIILDILAQDEAHRQYDIEMQVQRYSVYPQRALYYLCRFVRHAVGQRAVIRAADAGDWNSFSG